MAREPRYSPRVLVVLALLVFVTGLAGAGAAHLLRSATPVLWAGDLADDAGWQQQAGAVAVGKDDSRVVRRGPGGRDDVLEITFGRDGSRWGLDARSPFSALGVERQEEVWFSYDVYFPDDFEFLGDGKMGGLAGGVPDLDPFDVSSGGEYDESSFSVRAVWKQDRGLVMYLYARHGAGKDIEDPDNYGYGIVAPFVDRAGRTEGVLQPGRWHRVEHHVRLNDPGVDNGLYEMWLDGHRGISVDDVQYRTMAGEDIKIDQLMSAWFFGGPSSTYPTRLNQAYTDDWVLSGAELGPRPWRTYEASPEAPGNDRSSVLGNLSG